MPELPEVETITRGLRKAILGKSIKEVKALSSGTVKQSLKLFCREIADGEIKEIRRRGKYLLMDLSGGKTLLIHLGMTGKLLLSRPKHDSRSASGRRLPKEEKWDKHDHLIFRFCNADFVLRYNDQRKFGKLRLCNSCDEQHIAELKELGPESLEVSSSDFVEILKRRKAKIKSLLLDQKVIAGLGNIYADEALFEARIHPERRAGSLSVHKLRDLHSAIRKTLKRAIKAGGSSIDNYVQVNGQIGGFQLQHKVYGREGERCRRCRTKIKRIKINQRSSYFCPRCQPLRKA